MAISPRARTLFIGCSLILCVFIGVVLIWAGASFAPGLVGQVFRSIAGFLSTPLIMETSFGLVAFFIVLTVNSYRRQKEGDEYVSMEVPESPNNKDGRAN